MHHYDERTSNARIALEAVAHRLGPVFKLFDLDGVTEVNINHARSVFVTRNGIREEVDANQLQLTEGLIAQVIAELASSQGADAVASSSEAAVHARMPGYRFSGLMSPVSVRGSSLNIRKHSPRVLSLNDYVSSGTITDETARYLRNAVRTGVNILISGSTDSGKTTFLNALSREIDPGDRVISIEDTCELSLVVPDWVPWEYNGKRGVTPSLLVALAMRASPKRIILGEIKDAVAADFIEACNTGHEGCMATVHANSAIDALSRLEILTLRAGIDWPLPAVRQQIARVIGCVVQLRKDDGVRAVTEVIKIDPYGTPSIGEVYAYTNIFKKRINSNQ